MTEPRGSWLNRRRLDRRRDDESIAELGDDASSMSVDENLDASNWPGAEHFQLRERLLLPSSHRGIEGAAHHVPTYGVVLPSEPLASLDEATVARHATAISNGTRPTALALSWVEEREIRGEDPERFVVHVVLDGHHKLAAYARLAIPARILVLARLEDTWGPPDDRARWLRESLHAYSVSRPVARVGRD